MANVPLETFTAEVSTALGPRLVSFLLYGAAARGEVGAPADTLLICDAADEPLLAALEPVVRRWVAQGDPPPLVFTAREWRESADTFAVEYADIRAAHRVLAGADPWAGIVVDRTHERHQLERELRGKVLRLRQGLLASRGDARALDAMVRETAGVAHDAPHLLRRAGRCRRRRGRGARRRGAAAPPDPSRRCASSRGDGPRAA
jgi:hypothetical protein